MNRRVRAVLAASCYAAALVFFSTATYLWEANAHPGKANWIHALLNSLPAVTVWGILAPLILWTDRRIAGRGASIYRRLVLHLPASIVWTFVYLGIVLTLNPLLHGEPVPGWNRLLGSVLGMFHWNSLMYWVLVGVLLATDYYGESRQRELETARLETLLAEARLQALRAQLNPHFLFNSLNTISAFVERDPRRARRMIEHLGDFLRLTLNHFESQENTLEEELALLEHYLSIQRVRFEDRLQVSFDVAPAALPARVPTLLLQPLVENAVGHGVAAKAAPGIVQITARRQNGNLELSIRDDGPGLPPGWDLSRNAGVGLANTRERLRHLYPDRHYFAVAAAPSGGVIAEVSIPYHDGSLDE